MNSNNMDSQIWPSSQQTNMFWAVDNEGRLKCGNQVYRVTTKSSRTIKTLENIQAVAAILNQESVFNISSPKSIEIRWGEEFIVLPASGTFPITYDEMVDDFIIKLKKCENSKYKKIDHKKLHDTIIFDGKLDLSAHGLTKLPVEIGNLILLKELNLRFNFLKELPAGIGNLRELKSLDLSKNKFTELPATIGELCKLEALELNDLPELRILPPEIRNLTQLRALIMIENGVKELPVEIGELRELRQLRLYNNGFFRVKLPATIGNLSQLRELSISCNRLTELPAEIGKLTQLRELRLSKNQLTELPPEIGNLKELEILDLEENRLTKLPAEIGNLTKLERLNLNHNCLTELPATIGNMVKLEKVVLRHNRLTKLPTEIGNMRHLGELDLSTNQLLGLPSSIRSIRPLMILVVSYNPIALQGDEVTMGRSELRAQFGNRVLLSDPSNEKMSAYLTREEVYKGLDKQSPRLNRERLKTAKIPEIPGVAIEDGSIFIEEFHKIVSMFVFDDENAPGYLSHELLAGDYTNDAKPGSNWEKIRSNILPRLIGYFKTLYGMPLEDDETKGWQMYEDKKPALKKALSYIITELQKIQDLGQRASLFTLLVDGMLHCPTGQKEGIDTVVLALLEGKTARSRDLEEMVSNTIAIGKNVFFKTTILTKGVENTQNVHLISTYEGKLKEELGLSNVFNYNERIGIMGSDPFNNNPANVLQVFYGLITPQRVAGWIVEKSPSVRDLLLRKKLGELDRLRDKKSPELNPQDIAIIKSQIRSNSQFKPITMQVVLNYLIDKKKVNTNQDNWWKIYFSNDPTEDETAILTQEGAVRLLCDLGFIIL